MDQDKAAGILDHRLHWRWALPALLLLLAFPLLASAADAEFYVTLASRILIFALAATSLNLILGFGGMVSFGHAAFMGVGAYAVAIAMQQGLGNAWLVWPLAMGLSALFALLIGAISLRTQGVYFIMITLAFAQMLYFLAISIKAYGGDDGLQMSARSAIGGSVDLTHDRDFYYVTLLLVVLSIYAVARLLNARFGHVLQAIRENETRMTAIGFPVYRYKLVAFTLAGAMAGLSGVLLANLGGFVSPSIMQWSQSGMLMVMVILGGVGYLYGGFLGAVFFLLLEELLSHYTIHWQLGLGLVLLLVVLVAPNGLASLIKARKAN
ncbi:MAG: branched-chain amino acid ABC transporter permease [Polaromonas sp.]|nr:branched-chain amino acid ABC transporter permease [Polaromonas sp.]